MADATESRSDAQEQTGAVASAVASVERRLGRQICLLLCVLSLVIIAGRIAVVRSSTGEVPFQSANDRSRWATIAALVDYRTYVIDRLQERRDPETRRRTWQTIDRVQHRDSSGQIRNYSSKPPLLATMVAGLYAVLKSVTGLSIQQSPFVVGRILLAMFNLPLFALMIGCVASIVLRRCRSGWAAVALVAAMALGTLLTPFTITLNNHLPAASAVAAALWLLDTQSRRGATGWKMFAAGIAVAMAAANELPALAIVPLWTLMALWIDWRRAVAGYLPGAALVVAAFFGTNWIAHESLRPPYAHRGVGERIAVIETNVARSSANEASDSDELLSSEELLAPEDLSRLVSTDEIARALGVAPAELTVSGSRAPGRLRLDTPSETFAAVVIPGGVAIHAWDDWYDYSGTYWTHRDRPGIDRGERSRGWYAFHALVGHHGVFSLTPFWILSLVGAAMVLGSRKALDSRPERERAGEGIAANHPVFPGYAFWTTCVICLVTVVCTAFYLSRPLIDRNYGGVSIGFRWLIWMAPLWIYLAIPAVDRLARRRWGRALVLGLLAASVFSVATALESPWTHPWIYRWMQDLGWIAETRNR